MEVALPTADNPAVVVHGDCLDVLRAMPDGCADAVVTDPPYGITNERYDSASACVFDRHYWEQLARVCGANAASVTFGHTSTYHRLATAAEAGGWKVRQMWAWVYRDGMITSAYPKQGFDRLAPAMDPILYATRGKVLLNVRREGKAWDRKTGRSAATLAAPTRYSDKANQVRGEMLLSAVGHYPRAVVSDGCEPFDYFALPRASDHAQTDHPNEKPIRLMRWLVGKVPGRLILDPFLGSGTTAVAALHEGRQCLGVEKDAGYCAIARKRVAAAMGVGGLFDPTTQPDLFTDCREVR